MAQWSGPGFLSILCCQHVLGINHGLGVAGRDAEFVFQSPNTLFASRYTHVFKCDTLG